MLWLREINGTLHLCYTLPVKLINHRLAGFDDQGSAEGTGNVGYDEQVSYDSHPHGKPGNYAIKYTYVLH